MAIDRTYTPPDVENQADLEFNKEEAPAYKPPLGFTNIDLDFTATYSIPDPGDDLELVFGAPPSDYETEEETVTLGLNVDVSVIEPMLEIISGDIVLTLDIPEHLIATMETIISADIDFGLNIDASVIEPMLYAISDDLVLPINIDPHESEPVIYIDNDTLILTLNTDSSSIGGGQIQDLPTGIAVSGRIFPWGDTEDPVNIHHIFPFEEGIDIDNHHIVPFDEPDQTDKHSSSNWNNIIPYKDLQKHIPWGDFDDIADTTYSSNFIFMSRLGAGEDNSYHIPWGDFKVWLKGEYEFPFRYPDWKDKHHIHPEKNFVEFSDFSQYITYGDFKEKDVSHITYWGPYWYSLICGTRYFVPKICNLNFTPEDPNSEFGDPRLDPLNFSQIFTFGKCPYEHWHSGMRDRYEHDIIPVPLPQSREIYYMLNTITLRRLPDLTLLDCFTVDISTDIDSWLWDFSITLPHKDFLNLVKPSLSGSDLVLIDIEVLINSHRFICRVEGWSESVTFGQRSWTIRGRSPSVELAAPYALPGVLTNTTGIQGASLINDILQYTGWSVEWGFDDDTSTYSDYLNPVTGWYIPGNVFSVTEKTKIQAVQEVLKAIDGRIITTPDCETDKTLIIIPRYNVVPWQWVSTTQDVAFNASACWELSRQYESVPRINAVVVSGQTRGVVVNATINGTAGDMPSPMITDPLITTESAGSELAKNLLSKQGMWTKHSIKLFSLDDAVAPTGTFPSLIFPGKLVQVTEGVNVWKGQVTSTGIHGQSVGNKKGIEVTQTIGVEEYNG